MKKFQSQNSGKNTPCATNAAAVAGCRRSPPSQPNRYIQYGNTGCRVFKRGVQNWKYFA